MPTPWNYPLRMAVWKGLPALASEVGLPDGVFKVVTGAGPDAGTALSGHRDVDVVTSRVHGGGPRGNACVVCRETHVTEVASRGDTALTPVGELRDDDYIVLRPTAHSTWLPRAPDSATGWPRAVRILQTVRRPVLPVCAESSPTRSATSGRPA